MLPIARKEEGVAKSWLESGILHPLHILLQGHQLNKTYFGLLPL